jgi:hypothetical protein
MRIETVGAVHYTHHPHLEQLARREERIVRRYEEEKKQAREAHAASKAALHSTLHSTLQLALQQDLDTARLRMDASLNELYSTADFLGTIVVERLSHSLIPSGNDHGMINADRAAREREPLSADRALQYIVGVVGGLKSMHAVGRLAADYHGGQYMLSMEDRVKLSDVDCDRNEDENDSLQSAMECMGVSGDAARAMEKDAYSHNHSGTSHALPRSPRRDIVFATAVACQVIERINAPSLSNQQQRALRLLYKQVLTFATPFTLDQVATTLSAILLSPAGTHQTAAHLQSQSQSNTFKNTKT